MRGAGDDLAPWLALAAAVIAIDVAQKRRDRPTLTAACRRAMRHPVRRWPVLIVWGLVTSHLLAGRP